MTPERWQHLRDIFAAARELDPPARQLYLDRVCDGDRDLLAEIESLLSAVTASEGFLENAADVAADPYEGRRLDAYLLIRRIGQGGMGSVYLAARADSSFERRVAVKLMARNLASQEMVRKFRTERQILAGLDHPHIAELLDGGTTDEGLPYLVMEYVEGSPIDRYCEQRELSIRDRIELFMDLCSAVQFAHLNLVVHRDLKPANILVDDKGHLKLLDFGIAKLLNPELSREVAPTTPSLAALTPEYASPEQLTGEPVTTASDVYSLGVVLHQLLTGTMPYLMDRGSPAEIFRAICDTAPRPASQAAASRGDARLRRRLEGDLDNILLKTLEKKSHRRYPSVERLAEDLRRHLDGRPVTARPATWSYLAGKFLGRHPWGSAATTLLVASSLLFGLAMAGQKAEVERQRDRAEQAKELLVGLFESPDPLGFEGREPTLRQVLDRGASRLTSELADQPDVRAELLGVLGVVYRHLGDHSSSARMLEEAMRTLEPVAEVDSRAMAELRNNLAELRVAQGEYREAVELYRATLSSRGDRSPDIVTATALDGLGVAWHHLGKLEEAESSYRRALEARHRLLGPEHRDSATTESNLASVLFYQGRLAEAEKLHREVLELRRRTLGAEHVETAQSLNDLAAVLRRREKLEPSRALFETALELRSKLLGDRHPRLASTLNELAGLLEQLGSDGEAEAHYRRALEIFLAAHHPDHPAVAVARNNLANVLTRQGHLAEAGEHYRSALEIFTSTLGAGHSNTASARVNQARALHLGGDTERAEALYRESLPVLAETPGVKYAATRTYLAELLLEKGETAAAGTLARGAIETLRTQVSDDHWRLAAARSVLARCLVAENEAEAAEALLTASIQALESATATEARAYLASAVATLESLSG